MLIEPLSVAFRTKREADQKRRDLIKFYRFLEVANFDPNELTLEKLATGWHVMHVVKEATSPNTSPAGS